MIAIGASVLLRSYKRDRVNYRRVSSLLAAIAVLAAIDGSMGSMFDRFDAQIPAWVYLIFLPLTLSLLPIFPLAGQRRAWQQELLKFCAGYGLVVASLSFAFLLLHLILKSPLLAKHPTGSLVICITGMLAGIAVYSVSYRGRRPLPRLSRSSANFTSLAIFVVLAFGIGMFHTEMSDLKTQGDRSIKQLRDSRIALGETNIQLFQRLAERWELYPYAAHSRLMEVDINAYLQHIEALEGLLLVSPADEVVFERLKPSRSSYMDKVMADPVVREALETTPQAAEILVPMFGVEDLSAKIVVRVGIDFVESAGDVDTGVYSLLAVLDVRALLNSTLVTAIETDIETYTEVMPGTWMDRSGFWVSETTRNYLEENALRLELGTMDMYYSKGCRSSPIFTSWTICKRRRICKC